MEPKLASGSVAILDALGFKGIWRRHSVGEVLRKLNSMARVLKQMEGHWSKPLRFEGSRSVNGGPQEEATYVYHPPKLSIRFLSDTIVVGSSAHADGRAEDALWNVCRVCLLLTCLARREPLPRLLYRGVISSGGFLIDKNFLIGPAVDEAAELYELGQAASIWLAPSSVAIIDRLDIGVPSASEPHAYAVFLSSQLISGVPTLLKSGEANNTWTLAPFHGTYRKAFDDTMAAFGERPLPLHIELKRQATERWLDACEARVRELNDFVSCSEGPDFQGLCNIWLSMINGFPYDGQNASTSRSTMGPEA